jgi:G3E family GTPase
MIGFTLLGGYLGAGKTTLLNRLLAGCDGRRLGVLVNDFGAINIDASLIESRSDAQINLTNGCICCTLTDGFAEAIERLATAEQPPEHILVEASGVADVRQLAQYGRAPGMNLNGVLIVADAETLPAKVNDKYVGTTVRRQLGAGDLILLNKADLVTQAQLDERVSWLREAYPQARVIPCRHGQLPTELLLGIPSSRLPDRPVHPPEHEHYVSWHFERSTPISRAQLEAFSQRLDPAVLRAKGTVAGADGPGLLLQVVGRRREISRIEHAPPGTHLVAIGLQHQLDTARLDQLTAEWRSNADKAPPLDP